jgi:hypothetical protein
VVVVQPVRRAPRGGTHDRRSGETARVDRVAHEVAVAHGRRPGRVALGDRQELPLLVEPDRGRDARLRRQEAVRAGDEGQAARSGYLEAPEAGRLVVRVQDVHDELARTSGGAGHARRTAPARALLIRELKAGRPHAERGHRVTAGVDDEEARLVVAVVRKVDRSHRIEHREAGECRRIAGRAAVAARRELPGRRELAIGAAVVRQDSVRHGVRRCEHGAWCEISARVARHCGEHNHQQARENGYPCSHTHTSVQHVFLLLDPVMPFQPLIGPGPCQSSRAESRPCLSPGPGLGSFGPP